MSFICIVFAFCSKQQLFPPALLLVFVLALVTANNVMHKVPVQLVTNKHVFGEGHTARHFTAHLCGGCRVHKHIAVVSLNLQKEAWSYTLDDTVTAKVWSLDLQKQVADNCAKGVCVPTFNFTYDKSYGDLQIVVQDGAGSGMIYTLSLKFVKGKEATNSDCESRWGMNFVETLAKRKHVNTVTASGETSEVLVPIFEFSDLYNVETGKLIYLQLDYCFIEPDKKFNVSISVIANDQRSAFATYACLPNIKDCLPSNASFNDTSGSAANFVEVVGYGKPDIGPITVIVRGDGRFKEKNTFSFAASKFKEA